jgi:hypothetical protein
VVTFIDPDGVIQREGLGIAVDSEAGMCRAIRDLLEDPESLGAASTRCREFIAREYAEEKVLAPYLAAFDDAARDSSAGPAATLAGGAEHG